MSRITAPTLQGTSHDILDIRDALARGPQYIIIIIIIIRVVGHTMAWCYYRRYPGIHPPLSQAECNLGLIRSSEDLSAICVDGGMYLGARAFLEITSYGNFIAYERRGPANLTPWIARNLTDIICLKQQQNPRS